MSLMILGAVGGGRVVPGAGYTPFYTASFNGTPDSSNISEFTSSFPGTQYSNDITGPHGESIVLRNFLPAGSPGSFGGTMLDPPAVGLTTGDTVWFRKYVYFPTAFCAGYGTNPDGWGQCKWLRLQWQTGGALSRMTAQIGDMSSSACASAGTAPTFWGFTFEGINGTSNQQFVTPPAFSRDEWVAMQFAMHIHATEGWLRGWLNSTYLGEIGPIDTTPDNTGDGFTKMVLGDYWNGFSHQDNTWYLQDFIATKETPNTTDSGGRPYISPSTKVSDFA